MGKEVRQQQDLEALAGRALADLMLLDIGEWIERYLVADFLWDVEPMGLEGRYYGRDAFRSFFDDWTGAYDDWFLETEQLVAVSDEVVVAGMRQGGRPHGSTQTVELRYAAVTVWKDGLAQSTVNYSSFDDALAAAEELVK